MKRWAFGACATGDTEDDNNSALGWSLPRLPLVNNNNNSTSSVGRYPDCFWLRWHVLFELDGWRVRGCVVRVRGREARLVQRVARRLQRGR